MKQKLNPSHKSGDRNLFCNFYSQCLDHAAKRHWRHWSCCTCILKSDRHPVVAGPITSNEAILFYPLPQEIYQKII